MYSVYTHNPDIPPSTNISPLKEHLCFVANVRGGTLSKTVLDREFIISWLKNNIDHRLLPEKDSIIATLFTYDKKAGSYILGDAYRKEIPQLRTIVNQAMQELVNEGSYPLLDSYMEISSKFEEFGTMELGEFKSYLSEFIVENGKVYSCSQLSLF